MENFSKIKSQDQFIIARIFTVHVFSNGDSSKKENNTSSYML